MSEHRDEAEFLENQAYRVEEFIDFGKARPAVFPNAKAFSPDVTAGRSSRKPDGLDGEPSRQEPKE